MIRAAGGGGLERPGFGVAVLSTEGQRSSWALQPRQDLREPIKKRRKEKKKTESDLLTRFEDERAKGGMGFS